MLLLLTTLALASPDDSTEWVQPRASVGLHLGAADSVHLHPAPLVGLSAELHVSEPLSIALGGAWVLPAPWYGSEVVLDYPHFGAEDMPDRSRVLGEGHATVRFTPVAGTLRLGQRPVRAQLYAQAGGGAVYTTLAMPRSFTDDVKPEPEEQVHGAVVMGWGACLHLRPHLALHVEQRWLRYVEEAWGELGVQRPTLLSAGVAWHFGGQP